MADVQANAKLLCQSELAILPLFAGDSKDQATAEQLVKCIFRTRRASQ